MINPLLSAPKLLTHPWYQVNITTLYILLIFSYFHLNKLTRSQRYYHTRLLIT